MTQPKPRTEEEIATGTYGWVDPATGEKHVTRQQPICDFCFTPDPTWSFPAGYVKIEGHALMDASKDPWAACDECKVLIEGNLYNYLALRSLSAMKLPPDADIHATLAAIITNQARFKRARLGPPVREPTRKPAAAP